MLARSDVQLTRGCAAGCLRPIPLLVCGTADMATSVHAVMAAWHKNLGVSSRRFIIKQIGDN